ncbi:UNVERIFIED_CONTAM: hypothetical protein Slati_2758800 [Sesamum latifolium]|uniref:Uncharacterized protein n=1 Tax=Sesamum latifolium TaxID=2727402 RepID=A0AAW2VXI2_9LAMI
MPIIRPYRFCLPGEEADSETSGFFCSKEEQQAGPQSSDGAAVIPPTEENVQPSTQTLTDNSGEPPCKPIDKGKALVVYNPFNALMLADDDTDSSERGPKQSSPYSIDRC